METNQRAFVNVEVEKDVDFKPNFKFGIDYEVAKTFWVRTGLNTLPQTNSFATIEPPLFYTVAFPNIPTKLLCGFKQVVLQQQ